MAESIKPSVIAFADQKKIASGPLKEVAAKVKKYLQANNSAQVLIFDEVGSRQVEVDFRGSESAVLKRLEETSSAEEEKKTGPGRPKLGVVSKEVTLLPDHWDWLSLQPGGASVTLRRLVEESKKKNSAKDQVRQAQEATYKFMLAIAGDLPAYEEALRSLYAKDLKAFEAHIKSWPKDIRQHVLKLARPVF